MQKLQYVEGSFLHGVTLWTGRTVVVLKGTMFFDQDPEGLNDGKIVVDCFLLNHDCGPFGQGSLNEGAKLMLVVQVDNSGLQRYRRIGMFMQGFYDHWPPEAVEALAEQSVQQQIILL